MQLKKLNFSEFENEPNAWSLDGLIFENTNLLVGKNATGKTNTITKITYLGKMLSGTMPQLLESGNYTVQFSDDKEVYNYKLNILHQKVAFEELSINDELKFKRDSEGIGEIYSAQFKTNMNFQIPKNLLVVTSKRDAIQHPFLEKLSKWAEGLRMYSFNKLSRQSQGSNSTAGLFVKGEEEFGDNFKNTILKSMAQIGYELDNIGVTAQGLNLILFVNEKNRELNILQYQMSQGMFRALALIIQITYNSLKNLPTTIIIDDIGEGLDYERSTSLIKLITDVSEQGKCQIIMSTNDRYVMNNIPLKFWQVIDRNAGVCKVFNYSNSKELFDSFGYTGLNNFDFLATDFINSGADK